ncbi:MAG: phage tail assembly chaperone [Fluviibacter sp.]
MAFKLNISDHFWFTVKVPQITDAGKTVENHIKFKFKRLDIDERRERELRLGGDIYQRLMADVDGDMDALSGKFTAEMIRQGRMDKTSVDITDELMEIVNDWEDVSDDVGKMEFSQDNLLKLVKFLPNLPQAINDAYRQAYSGELKRGN